MFQTPVYSLAKIRKARKRVKQLLLQIGLETCKEACEELNTYNPGDTHFSSTSWEDVSLWEAYGRRNGYRTKPFCCSLCNFQTKLLASYKNHLQRYHEDEKDTEILSTCPSCPFISHTKNVVTHMRMFHSSVRKVQAPAAKESSVKTTQFSCAQCSFTDNLYYTTKKHVLMVHHKSELEKYFGERTEDELNGSSGLKVTAANRFYCKKCNFMINNQDALMYHIVTSEKHRDLDQMMRPDICDISRPRVRKPCKKYVDSSYGSSPQLLGSPATPPNTDAKQPLLIQNGPSQASPSSVSNLVKPVKSVPDPSGGLVKTSSTIAPTAQVGFVTSLPQNQNITLQASLPQSVFLSPRFALNQPVTATMLPSCNVGGQIRPGAQASVRPTVLPINQTLTGNLLPVNQQTLLACSQPLQSLQVNQAVGPTVISVNQPLTPGSIPGQPSQNTFLAAPVIRQLIPTGKQVNGIPTYTLVTLPVGPCTIPAVNPPKVPVQLSQADKVAQASTSPASAPSPPVVNLVKGTSKKAPNPAPAKSHAGAAALLDKETKQWKTCPVCNELFPSNVFEVHVQVAHIKQENKPEKPQKYAASNAPKEAVVVAAHASFLKVLKEKTIRCVTCRAFTQEKEVLQHLLMHGMVCLYCKAVFYELRNFVYHMKILHVNKKKIHGDFVKKGITLSCDANGTALFPRFDFTAQVSKEELGEKEMHIAVVAGATSNTATPLYIKVQSSAVKESSEGGQGTKCSFCDHVLSKSESYETHLKERHHIMPTVHTILKSPAFKCIHCCGVYTGGMTLSAIALHLQRCRNAPKDSIAALELESAASKGQDNAKAASGTEDQTASNESKTGLKNGLSASCSSPVPSKRRRLDPKTDPSDISALEQHVNMLVMIPDASATVSNDAKKEFLLKYFHVRAYPSKREIELLAHVLDMWKSDVASFFGTRRYICMKFLKNNKARVLLGFKVNDLKRLQHDIDLPEDY
ncbi:activity-dependent neuroprotector homeobox protein 2 [Gastrophryne carolinensis]